MADPQKDQQPKPKMISEQEHNERLVKEIERQQISNFTHEIKHGFQTHGNRLAPDVTIRLLGGEVTKVQELTLKIEQLVIDFAKDNPPQWIEVGEK